ncbi:M20/M25/M40 family metallo-hydrolase [Hyphococcus sp.]|uniref:M20/M25/M40 family metallo-hydrolase n=1 Tax=Hyphococcus sp. TaxID=2038636 RepID=UPI003D0BA010
MRSLSLSALSLFVSALPFAAAAQDAPLTPPELTAKTIDLLGKTIAIESVEGKGKVPAVAELISAELQKGGFAKDDIVIERHGETATLVATYKGTGEKGPILLSAHMDVVGANPEDWTRDPFTMVEEDGFLFGRGVTDNKFGMVMMVQTLIRLKQEGFTPNRDLVLALSGDEETTMATTMILADALEGADIVLNSDGGGGGLGEDGEPVAYYLQGAEKTYADYTVTFTNAGGHSSLPRKDNAIYDLAKAALNISNYEFPVMWSDITLESFRQAAAQTEGELGKAMADFAANPKDKKAIKILSERPEYVGQLRTTCVATQLDGGHAPNALPQRAEMNVNCRIFPGVDPAEVEAKLVELIDNPDATVELADEVHYSDASPLRDDVVAAVRKAVDKRYPGLPIVPEMSAGASDSLHFRAHGIDSYGVSGIFMKPSDMYAHGLNERVPVAAVDGALDHWHTLLTALASGE